MPYAPQGVKGFDDDDYIYIYMLNVALPTRRRNTGGVEV